MLPKFKIATRGRNKPYFWGAQNLKKEIVLILLSHSPRYGDLQVIFSGFTEIKMVVIDQLHNFLWAQKLKCQKLFKFFYHIFYNMEMCKSFFKVFLKFKMAATSTLFNYL